MVEKLQPPRRRRLLLDNEAEKPKDSSIGDISDPSFLAGVAKSANLDIPCVDAWVGFS